MNFKSHQIGFWNLEKCEPIDHWLLENEWEMSTVQCCKYYWPNNEIIHSNPLNQIESVANNIQFPQWFLFAQNQQTQKLVWWDKCGAEKKATAVFSVHICIDLADNYSSTLTRSHTSLANICTRPDHCVRVGVTHKIKFVDQISIHIIRNDTRDYWWIPCKHCSIFQWNVNQSDFMLAVCGIFSPCAMCVEAQLM